MSAAATVWWVRHGPTHAKTMVGWTDLPADLSDTGQVARLAALLPDAPVVSSDLARARQTADALAGQRPRLAAEPALREIHFGAWENRSFAEIDAETPELAAAFWSAPGEPAPPGGESWNQLCARVTAAVDRLTASGGTLIVVAHFGVILSQLARARPDAPVFSQTIAPLSATRLVRREGQWHCELVDHCP